ncbi:MAG: DUF427 domain-containing protein [Halioglobus sp.]
MKALWQGQIVAESDDTVVVEGNHYFPRDSLQQGYIQESTTTSHCPWKGTAYYYSLLINGEINVDAVWYYPEPKPAASETNDRVAFWRGVQVTD